MATALEFVFQAIGSAVNWLTSWQFPVLIGNEVVAIPFLYIFIGITVISVLMRFAL